MLEEACRAQQEEGLFEVVQDVYRPGGGLAGVSAATGGSEAQVSVTPLSRRP